MLYNHYAMIQREVYMYQFAPDTFSELLGNHKTSLFVCLFFQWPGLEITKVLLWKEKDTCVYCGRGLESMATGVWDRCWGTQWHWPQPPQWTELSKSMTVTHTGLRLWHKYWRLWSTVLHREITCRRASGECIVRWSPNSCWPHCIIWPPEVTSAKCQVNSEWSISLNVISVFS